MGSLIEAEAYEARRFRGWGLLPTLTPMHGIVTLHSGDTARVRVRASASDGKAHSAATAVSVLNNLIAPGEEGS